MPIVHFINSRSQTSGGMKNVLAYIGKEEKISADGRRFLTELNCSEQTACEEFTATKHLFHKPGGRMYYHLVQSFPAGYPIPYELAHRIAVEFAQQAFGKYECVVATHTDRDHVHSHIVLNSVSFEDGKKYHSNLKTVEELMALSDSICQKYDVPILDKPERKSGQKKKDTLSDREFRSARKGGSDKFTLMNVINQIMKQAKTKKQFCYLMRQQGYGVRWEDSRKYITYTCPGGRRFRDKRLHGEKFTKEMMELEFEIRRTESTVQQETGAGSGHAPGGDRARFQLESTARTEPAAMQHAGGNAPYPRRTDDQRGHGAVPPVPPGRADADSANVSGDRTDYRRADSSGDVGAKGECQTAIRTGWEPEREEFLATERARRTRAQEQTEMAPDGVDLAGVLDGVVGSISAAASVIDEPEDGEEIERHSDSKALAEERRRKEQLGLHMS